jgi:hypothetical protein
MAIKRFVNDRNSANPNQETITAGKLKKIVSATIPVSILGSGAILSANTVDVYKRQNSCAAKRVAPIHPRGDRNTAGAVDSNNPGISKCVMAINPRGSCQWIDDSNGLGRSVVDIQPLETSVNLIHTRLSTAG